MDMDYNIKKATAALGEAGALLITAGAGIGVDSGLPDFRGNEGFWRAYPPIARLGISFSEMADPRWFDTRPGLAWGFYGHRLNLYRRTIPHDGFSLLLNIGVQKPGSYFVFTSNVDGQFQKAGFDERRIVECHGSIHHLQCTRVCSASIWEAEGIEVYVDERTFEAKKPLPHCVNCGGLARPNILMFGDWNWISHRTDMQGKRLSEWLNKLKRKGIRLAIVELGAGEAVPTVRMKSEITARRYNSTLIRINPHDYSVSDGHIPIPMGSAEGMRRIYEILKNSYP